MPFQLLPNPQKRVTAAPTSARLPGARIQLDGSFHASILASVVLVASLPNPTWPFATGCCTVLYDLHTTTRRRAEEGLQNASTIDPSSWSSTTLRWDGVWCWSGAVVRCCCGAVSPSGSLCHLRRGFVTAYCRTVMQHRHYDGPIWRV